MIIVNGVKYQHGMFGYLEDSKLLCEMVNMTDEEASHVFEGSPRIEFINADGFSEDFTGMKLVGFMDDVVEKGNTGVILKR